MVWLFDLYFGNIIFQYMKYKAVSFLKLSTDGSEKVKYSRESQIWYVFTNAFSYLVEMRCNMAIKIYNLSLV